MPSSFEMRRVRNGAFALLGAVALFLLTAHGGRAAEQEATPVNRWLHDWSPALNVEFGIHAQELKATGATTFGSHDNGTNTVSTLLVRIEAGIATPPLSAIPGRPRLVLRSGGSLPLRETGATIVSSTRIEAAELGTDFSMSFRDMWHSGIDLRFLLPIPNQTIVIQPGFEYLQSRFRFQTDFSYRAQPSPGNSDPPTYAFNGRSDPDVHRFIGPTLSVEGNVLRLGPLGINAYVQGRMYFLIGDRDTVVNFTQPLLNQPQTAMARMEANFLAGQVGFGIRGSF